MKITDVKVINKYSNGTGPSLIEVESDEGITGIGATASNIPVIAAIIEEGPASLKKMLLGSDPRDTTYLWDKMTRTTMHGRYGDGGYLINAIAAVDMALWDIRGKSQNMPIHQLLGGAIQSEIMAYASTSRWNTLYDGDIVKTTDELVIECKEYVDDGFKAIKFGWGNFFNNEADYQLSAMREAIGPDIRLMLDYGCPAYLSPDTNVKELLKICNLLEKHDIFFLEEPLSPHDIDGFTELTACSPIRIATGESLTKISEFFQFIKNKATDVAQPDVQQMGISGLKGVLDLCEISNTLCIPHCPWSAMAVAGHINVLSCSNVGNMIEYTGYANFEKKGDKAQKTSAMFNKIIEIPLSISNGYLQLPTSPGLGLGNYVHQEIESIFKSN
ncbi:MAG: mandelate racemase/muconate lactonizing enzyme family protein [SAR202 cluster bacterium]|nr:mandelate racemase/muconate lactonizing enzyme family protein [SAR202 cluster bacterium]|tara:strand:- start:1270 stop:2430 length:1161 start_codon:yes stop_codon:yes gene_type:complete